MPKTRTSATAKPSGAITKPTLRSEVGKVSASGSKASTETGGCDQVVEARSSSPENARDISNLPMDSKMSPESVDTKTRSSGRTTQGKATPADSKEPIKQDDSSASDDARDEERAWVDDSIYKAEQDAHDRRVAGDSRSARQKPTVTADKRAKLDRLLDQADLYSTFLVEQVSTVQEEWESLDQAPQREHAPEGDYGAGAGKRKRTGGSVSPKKRAKAETSSAPSPSKTMVPLIQGELKLYQLKGVAWLISLWTNGINGILADQMGLGKTVQTIAFLSHLRANGINGPFLVIVPLSTLMNWHKEIKRWCPSMASIIYHGDKQERLAIAQKWMRRSFNSSCPPEFPVIVTSFEIAIRDRKALSVLKYKYMVVDEGHRLKNSDCRLTRELRELDVENKLLLTGTPLQNNLAELWSLLNFLLPDIFNNLQDFESWFDFSDMVSSDAAEREDVSRDIFEAEAKDKMVSKLHKILKPFLLRRVKADVEASMPGKQEIVIYAPLTAAQQAIQDQIVSKDVLSDVQSMAARDAIRTTKLNNMLMQLRKNCNHPDLITCEWTESTTFPPADELVRQSGKMALLDTLLQRLKRDGHKVLIFSQFTKMLDILDSYLEERGHSVRRIDGAVGYQERMQYMDEFNEDPDCFVFLLSTRAGGLGINLVSADTVIFYDSDWNPHQDMQAMDRAHRIGQTRPVLVLRLCTANSVETKLLQRAASKLALERLVIRKGAFQGAEAAAPSSAALSAKDLLDVLQGRKTRLALQGEAQQGVVTPEILTMLLDRTHLKAKTAIPYSMEGPGYEVIEDHSGGMLASVQ